jgi:hypothetical protein
MVGNHRTYQSLCRRYFTFVAGNKMKINELANLLKTAATAGADKALAGSGALSDSITKAEAYRRYGRGNVDRWLKEKLFRVSAKHIDRQKLAQVAAGSNRITYLPAVAR